MGGGSNRRSGVKGQSRCTTMAEAAGGELPVVAGQEYRVKLGKSFTFPRENAFHTIKCKQRAGISIVGGGVLL